MNARGLTCARQAAPPPHVLRAALTCGQSSDLARAPLPRRTHPAILAALWAARPACRADGRALLVGVVTGSRAPGGGEACAGDAGARQPVPWTSGVLRWDLSEAGKSVAGRQEVHLQTGTAAARLRPVLPAVCEKRRCAGLARNP